MSTNQQEELQDKTSRVVVQEIHKEEDDFKMIEGLLLEEEEDRELPWVLQDHNQEFLVAIDQALGREEDLPEVDLLEVEQDKP